MLLAMFAGMVLGTAITRRWAEERFQWGATIGKHDEIAGMIADMAADTFAMQAVADLGCRLVDLGGYDVRLEAACAKLYNTEIGWRVVNDWMRWRGMVAETRVSRP